MKRRPNQKKDKFIMLASSLFVLSALTLTGVYVKERSGLQQDAPLDLTQLYEQEKEAAPQVNDDPQLPVKQANADDIINPKEEEVTETETETDTVVDEVQESAARSTPLTFSMEEGLALPVAGEVLLPYSMDKTVYFETLDQYRYNPAIIISANVGDIITATTDGIVTQIYEDPQLGKCLIMDLGDGYTLTYGQLENIAVKEGEYIESGAFIASVAEPTKYFSVEGSNLYFALKKEGMPMNPMGETEE